MNYCQDKDNPFPSIGGQCLGLIPNHNSKIETCEAKESCVKLSLKKGIVPQIPSEIYFEPDDKALINSKP